MERFKPYLEAVSESGGRTRTFIYVMILVNFCILAASLNSIGPDWNDLRLEKLKIALACFDLSTKDSECNQALNYATQRGFELSEKGKNTLPITETTEQLKISINNYIQKSIDENSFRIPVFDVPLDVNDLWVLSGVLNCYLMFVLVICFDREYDDLKLGVKNSQSTEDLELILSTQMFGRSSNGTIARFSNLLFKVSVVFGPFALHFRVVYRCFQAFSIYDDLSGMITAIFILALCSLTLIILLYFGLRAFKAVSEIENVVTRVENQLHTSIALKTAA